MKTVFRSTLILLIFVLLGAPNIYFNILIPSVVDLPDNIKTLALVDRSQSENYVVNVLEKGLISTLSGKGDRISKTCIDGLYDQLNSGNSLKPIVTGIVEKRKGTALDFPEPMQWFEIENICKEYQTNAVLSLEIFSKHINGNVAEVKVGFRLYDPSNKRIIDEFQYFHGINAPGHAGSDQPEAIVSNLINNDDAMKKASFIAGTIYGKRIAPFWIRVKRDYYKKSKRDPKMAEGARMMEVNNWDAAIEAFQLAIEQGHPKTKGKAAYNLAVVYEITGDIDLAFSTVQDAWGKFGNKAAREYSGILQQRINEINVLKNQQQN